MNKPQRTGKKFYSLRSLLIILLLTLIPCGPVIAMVIAYLASPLSRLKISLKIAFVSFLIIYTIIIVIFIIIIFSIFSDKLRSGILRDVVNSIKNSIKSHPGYFFFPFMISTALGFILLLSDLLYKFLRMSSISELLHELLQLYPMLFTGAITSTSIMFAVTYWVANRAENIVKLIVTIQTIKILAMATYILALFLVFAPLSIIPSLSNYTSTSIPCSKLYSISFLLSYPFGLTAGMILTSIILDIFAVALRYELSENE